VLQTLLRNLSITILLTNLTAKHDVILNKTNIRSYVDHLQKVKNYAGTTVLERVGWLNAAIDYLTEDSIQAMKLHLKAYNQSQL